MKFTKKLQDKSIQQTFLKKSTSWNKEINESNVINNNKKYLHFFNIYYFT